MISFLISKFVLFSNWRNYFLSLSEKKTDSFLKGQFAAWDRQLHSNNSSIYFEVELNVANEIVIVFLHAFPCQNAQTDSKKWREEREK